MGDTAGQPSHRLQPLDLAELPPGALMADIGEQPVRAAAPWGRPRPEHQHRHGLRRALDGLEGQSLAQDPVLHSRSGERLQGCGPALLRYQVKQ